MPSLVRAALLTCLLAGPLYAADPAAVREVVYKKVGDVELKLSIHTPADWKASDKRPAIVFFFGGGWTNGTAQQFETQAAYLATRGMVAARADYRVKSRQGVTPDACVEDAKSAVRWLRQHAAEWGIDTQRIVAAGGSAGGHIAACTSLTPGLDAASEDAQVSSRPNALVLFNPVLKFEGVAQLTERLGNKEDLARQLSPTVHLTKETPPTLMFYGTADQLIAQGQEFVAKSKELGHASELVSAEGEKHGYFNRSPWKERTLYKTDEFLTALGYLTGKPTLELPK